MASKRQPSLGEERRMKSNKTADEDREAAETLNTVSSHLYLKPSKTSETPLNKDQVLRCIRHRKRVNQVNNALQALLSSPFSSFNSVAAGSTDKVTTVQVDHNNHSWLDDAFSAP